MAIENPARRGQTTRGQEGNNNIELGIKHQVSLLGFACVV